MTDIDVPSSLVGGGPLVIEDLDVVMSCVTYEMPYIYRETSFYRLLRQLDYRGIQYVMEKRNRQTGLFAESNVTMTIGERELKFSVV